MPTPVVVLSETNGPSGSQSSTDIGGTITFASLDDPSNTSNLVALAPITQGTSSFEKWLRAHVSIAPTNSFGAFTVGWSATPPQDSAGGTASTIKYGVNAGYATPTNSPSGTAAVATLGVSGVSIVAPASSAGAYSGYITLQLNAANGAAGGDMVFPSAFQTITYLWS